MADLDAPRPTARATNGNAQWHGLISASGGSGASLPWDARGVPASATRGGAMTPPGLKAPSRRTEAVILDDRDEQTTSQLSTRLLGCLACSLPTRKAERSTKHEEQLSVAIVAESWRSTSSTYHLTNRYLQGTLLANLLFS